MKIRKMLRISRMERVKNDDVLRKMGKLTFIHTTKKRQLEFLRPIMRKESWENLTLSGEHIKGNKDRGIQQVIAMTSQFE